MDAIFLERRLLQLGVRNVEAFRAKLVANTDSPEVTRDLLSEAAAAIMFTTGGFTVEMHDRPDLWLTGFGQTIAAEVKHFRYKNQDSLDDFVLRNHGDYLVEFGDPSVTEGLVAWDQVASVARRKAVQFKGHTPYLLVVENSSLHCIDDVVVRTAANILDEEASNVAGSPVSRLNGIVLLSNESRMPEGRNVYFFELNASQHSLPHSARAALRGIRRWGY